MFDGDGVDGAVVLVGGQVIPSVFIHRHCSASFTFLLFLQCAFDETLLDPIVRVWNQLHYLVFKRQPRMRESEGGLDEFP